MKQLIEAEVSWLSSYVLKERPLSIKTPVSELRVSIIMKARRHPDFSEFTVETEGGLVFDILSSLNKDAVFYRPPRLISYREKKAIYRASSVELNLKGEPASINCQIQSFWSNEKITFIVEFPQKGFEEAYFLISEFSDARNYLKGWIGETVSLVRKEGEAFIPVENPPCDVILEEGKITFELGKELFRLPFGYGEWRFNFMIIFDREEVVFSPSFSRELKPELSGLLLYSPA